jgi:hypothetical protein
MYLYESVWLNFPYNGKCFRQICGGNQNASFVFGKLSPNNLAVYEIMWINMEGAHRPQMAIWRMRVA